jgi:hypothetical protein
MKIITVNLPMSYLKQLDSYVGDMALYPSRSELIRVAVRDFLIRELQPKQTWVEPMAPVVPKPEPEPIQEPIPDPALFVQVPQGLNGEVKTFRLVKKESRPA